MITWSELGPIVSRENFLQTVISLPEEFFMKKCQLSYLLMGVSSILNCFQHFNIVDSPVFSVAITFAPKLTIQILRLTFVYSNAAFSLRQVSLWGERIGCVMFLFDFPIRGLSFLSSRDVFDTFPSACISLIMYISWVPNQRCFTKL